MRGINQVGLGGIIYPVLPCHWHVIGIAHFVADNVIPYPLLLDLHFIDNYNHYPLYHGRHTAKYASCRHYPSYTRHCSSAKVVAPVVLQVLLRT